MKNLLKIFWISFTFIQAMQNGQKFWQLLLWPLPKFGGKVQNFFLTQAFDPDQISFCFISFTNKFFYCAQISQHNETQHNDTQHNDTQHNDTQYNGTQNNDTQHNDTQHNDTQHNDTQQNAIQNPLTHIMTVRSF